MDSKKFVISTAVILALSNLYGCNATMQKEDQLGMRSTLLSLYEDQMMDNLYRTYNGLPIVQVDYTQIVGTTALTSSENASGGQNNTLGINTNNTPISSALVPLTNVYNWTAGLTATQSRQIAMTANPVTVTTLNGSDDIYAAYLEYLEERSRLQDFGLRHPPLAQMPGSVPPPLAEALVITENRSHSVNNQSTTQQTDSDVPVPDDTLPQHLPARLPREGSYHGAASQPAETLSLQETQVNSTTDTITANVNADGKGYNNQPTFQYIGGPAVIDEVEDGPTLKWNPGDGTSNLSAVRLMVTLREPKRGEYLDGFIKRCSPDGQHNCFYWIPNWRRDAVANNTRTEFFNLYRLVTLARPPSLKAQSSGGQGGGQGAQSGGQGQAGQSSQGSSSNSSSKGPSSQNQNPNPIQGSPKPPSSTATTAAEMAAEAADPNVRALKVKQADAILDATDSKILHAMKVIVSPASTRPSLENPPTTMPSPADLYKARELLERVKELDPSVEERIKENMR